MSTSLATVSSAPQTQLFVTFRLGPQRFAVPVAIVRDVLRYREPTSVPLAPPVIPGVLALGGNVVTALDLRQRLGMPVNPNPASAILVVIDDAQERFALIVDSIAEALDLPMENFQRPPATIDAQWREVIAGVFALERELLIVLDPAKVIDGQGL